MKKILEIEGCTEAQLLEMREEFSVSYSKLKILSSMGKLRQSHLLSLLRRKIAILNTRLHKIQNRGEK